MASHAPRIPEFDAVSPADSSTYISPILIRGAKKSSSGDDRPDCCMGFIKEDSDPWLKTFEELDSKSESKMKDCVSQRRDE
jgi:hypothetical protein